MAKKALTKTQWEKLEKDLCRARDHVWARLSAREKEAALAWAEAYKVFLDAAKTEREAVAWVAGEAAGRGFVPAGRAAGRDRRLLWTFHGKVAALAVTGRRPAAEGLRIIASHIDAPRLDLKQNPLYQELDMAFLKTHYYGGIKKFHWVTRPLALHGRVLKADGTAVDLRLGDRPEEPVLVINDLLPHLAGKVQAEKKIREAIPAEKLNVLVGGLPLEGPKGAKEAVRLGVLRLLHREYGLVEEDLVSAELELVPADNARDVGLDRAFVGGYGQDDRSCSYAAVRALFDVDDPEYTCLVFLLDKEEIGSDGNTGAKSRLLEVVLFDLLRHVGGEVAPDAPLRACLASRAISGDVTAGVDPDYQEVHEKRNDALVGYGPCLTKYTGSRGKYGANDAHAEYVNWIRRTWNRAKVVWQAGELGRVDEGGGGTVAKYLAHHGMDIVDAGPPVLSMHAPFEVVHKGDLYMLHRAYRAFFEGAS
ncbi:aminopeptidase [Dissulfurirhabdus thermomarina]|uniref:M18 family aminopeptidase n=1 Tax=Dissulfurirhabdus thermomarina TaxID=1765737 RepID=A0A6N9TY85_DISTH|nr:aminopeptidase [Dissulfurirhabdus thermomarina]NDY43436.1 aminopeptidase [Dissulfurirhabdus thermomarina]NMX23960.1 aminopeptidase [Dissulfurirhabdus thermomarina]